MSKTLCHRLSIRRITLFTEETKDYLHAVKTSSSKSVSCIFGIVLLLEREPRRQDNNNNNNNDNDNDNIANNDARLIIR